MCSIGTSFIALRDNATVRATGPALDDVFCDEALEICNAAEDQLWLRHRVDVAIEPPTNGRPLEYRITAMQGCAIDPRIVARALELVRTAYRSRVTA